MHTLFSNLKSFALPLALILALVVLIWVAWQVAKIKRRNASQPLFGAEDLTPNPASPPPLPPNAVPHPTSPPPREMSMIVFAFRHFTTVDWLIIIVIFSILGSFTLRAWSKQNLTLGNTRVVRALIEKRVLPNLDAPKPQTEKTVMIKPAEKMPDRCPVSCTAATVTFDEHPVLDDFYGTGYAFFEGECTGADGCEKCQPAAPKRDTDPKPTCWLRPAQ